MTRINQQQLLRTVLRNDFVAFVEKCMGELSSAVVLMRNWHLLAMAHQLELCRLGQQRRLLITLPPRHLKSVTTSVAFVAWLLGHDPTLRIVCVSYSRDLADALARECRAIMESKWYKELFPKTRLSRKRSADADFTTTERGGRFATSLGGTLTGRGGNVIIIDDPMKAEDAASDSERARVIRWYRETLITRLDDKRNDCIIAVMQRLHIDDLAGYLIGTGEWTQLKLPAIAVQDEVIPIGNGEVHHRRAGQLLHPEREPQEIVDELRRSLGERAFAAQYQQEPAAPDGTILRWSWFNSFDCLEREADDEIVLSWDTAAKAGALNDYSVCTVWLVRGEAYYLLDLYRGRLEFPDLVRKVKALADERRADWVLIEDTSSGQGLIQQLERDRGEERWWVEKIRPEDDKITRASTVSVPLERGQVFLKAGADYLEELRKEIVNFPRGHDDQVDSITQFLLWMQNRIKYATKIEVKWPY